MNAMRPHAPGFSIISCSVFRREIEAYLPDLERPPLSVDFFEIGLHLEPLKMRAQLQKMIDDTASKAAPESILLLCGLCGNAVLGLSSPSCALVLPRMHDCLSMFLGGAEAYEKLKRDCPRAYFASPGWIDGGLLASKALHDSHMESYSKKYSGDPEILEELSDAFFEQFKEYDTYFYAEFLPCPKCEAQCAGHAEFMGWGFRKIESDDRFFKAALRAEWDGRFLVVPRGKSVRAAAGKGILDFGDAS